MNTIYGNTAVEAFLTLKKDKNTTPENAWDTAVKKFTSSTDSIKKGCPKTTFLAVCDLGKLNLSIPKTIIKQTKNYHYTEIMLKYILENNGKIESKKELWNEVKNIEKKALKSNSQDAVIFSLLKNGYLNY